jgi:hypothetical protein
MVIGMEIVEDRRVEEPVVLFGPVVPPLNPIILPVPAINNEINVPEAIANVGESSDGELKAA